MKRGVIPKGDKLVILATSIRWFGWGLFEALLPIFLFQFANTYAETGLLSSIYNILFFFVIVQQRQKMDQLQRTEKHA